MKEQMNGLVYNRKISVIIPMWNVENYICDALASIKKQTFVDYELICVDDGSVDNTYSICENYLKNNFNYFKLLKIPHSGVSTARNIALDNVNGEYIFFLDSDDIILNNFVFEQLLDIMNTYHCDIVLSKYFNTNGRFSNCMKKKNIILNTDSILNEVIINKIHFNPSLYFCRSSILKNLRFVENIYMEDMVFFIDILLNSKTVYFSDIITICKRVREGAITNSNGKYEYYNIIALDIILTHLKNNISDDVWNSYVIVSEQFIQNGYRNIINDEYKDVYSKLHNKFKEKYHLT